MKSKHLLSKTIGVTSALAASLLFAPASRAVTIYVSNSGNNTIAKITDGVATTFASTGLSFPEGLAFDQQGNLFVANRGNNTIMKFDTNGVGSVFASTGLGAPQGLAFDNAGNLFVANIGGGTIMKFTPTGVGTLFATIGMPAGLAFDRDGNLFATTVGFRITKFTTNGVASFFAQAGAAPGGLAFDAAGNLYVGNGDDNTIGKFTPAGLGSIFANTGLSGPEGVAFDNAGNLYVVNNHNNTVQVFTPGGVGSQFAGSGLNVPTFVAVAPANSPSPPCVPAPSDLIGWWPAEGNGDDLAGGNTATLLNGTTYATGKIGQGFSLDGVNDRVSLGDPENLRFTNSFAFESWINPRAYPPPSQGVAFIFFRGDTRFCLDPYYLALLSSGKIKFHLEGTSGPSCGVDLETATTIASNQWTHLAGVFNSAEGVMQIYLNGTLSVQFATTVKPFRDLVGGGVVIGNSDIGDNESPFNGVVDEPSVYGRALSALEILAIYNAGNAGKCPMVPPPPACAPTSQSLIGWWAGENNATDWVSGNNGTLRNGATFAVGRVNQAFSLDGVNDFVDVENVPNLGTNDFAIEFWVRFNTVAGEQVMVEKYIETGNSSRTGWTITKLANNSIRFAQAGLNLNVNFGSVAANTWTHVAVVRSNGVVRAYLNGSLSRTVSTMVNLDTTSSLKFGHRGGPSDTPGSTDLRGFYLNGLLDEVGLFARALSTAEIQAIYSAGSAGKCQEPPVILTQPASQRLTVGSAANFGVVAGGTPQFRYQWRFNNDDITGATDSALDFTITETSGGLYSVRVTNAFGLVMSSDAELVVNHAPVADASATRLMVISPNNATSTVVLDGSRSSDMDGDALQYHWYETGVTNPVATGVVAVVVLPLGAHSLELVVNDGLATDTNVITVEVLTPSQAVERLAAVVREDVSRAQPLIVTLSAALAAIDRSNPTAAINQLMTFQNKVRAQVVPLDSALAETLIRAAQDIIDSLVAGSGRARGKFTSFTREADGETRLKFEADPGALYIIQASTNLVDWEVIGVAYDRGSGAFEFDDATAARFGTRYYRIMSP